MIIKGKEFKEIPGFKGYGASEDGEIYSFKTSKILNQSKRGLNYKSIKVSDNGKQRTQFVHILIALAWVPIPEEYKDLKISTYINRSLIVDHIDGDKENNNADNLRWCTSYENSNFGNFEKNSKALIGNQNAKGGKQHGRSERYIYTYEGNDYTMKELAEFLECSKSRITEAFRRNLGLVKQGRLTRRLIK